MCTHTLVLNESFPMNTNMTGFRGFSKYFCSCALDERSQYLKGQHEDSTRRNVWNIENSEEAILYNWLIWRVLKLAFFFFKKVFSLCLYWRLEQSEQRHLYVDIFLCDLYFGVEGHSPKNAKLKTTPY